MKKAQCILILVLAFFIFSNLKIMMGIVARGQKVLDSTDVFPGTPFLFLRPHLMHQFQAGYYDDRTPANPDLDPVYARNFQTAEFALAPTILDHEKPWDHDLVIVCFSGVRSIPNIIKHWPSRIIAFNGSNIVLLRRLK